VGKVDGILDDVSFLFERRRDVHRSIGDDQWRRVARHVHDETMADAPLSTQATVMRHDGAH
jgi:hypothetical protein